MITYLYFKLFLEAEPWHPYLGPPNPFIHRLACGGDGARFNLSLPLDPASGDALPPKVEYRDHEKGIPHLARLLGVEEHQVPDGLGSATEIVRARTHNGTHMDAPWHFYPTSEGHLARTIDQIPLEPGHEYVHLEQLGNLAGLSAPTGFDGVESSWE